MSFVVDGQEKTKLERTDEVAKILVENEITLVEVIDTIIIHNAIIGVGLISLEQDTQKIIKRHY